MNGFECLTVIVVVCVIGLTICNRPQRPPDLSSYKMRRVVERCFKNIYIRKEERTITQYDEDTDDMEEDIVEFYLLVSEGVIGEGRTLELAYEDAFNRL